MPLIFALAMLLLAAGGQRPADVVKWSVEPAAAPVAPGGVAKLEISADIQPGWKLYAIEQVMDGPRPLVFGVAGEAPFKVSSKQIQAPKPKVWKDENFDGETRYYENAAAFKVPVSVPANVRSGRQRIPLEVTFQACGQDICLRPYTQKLDVDISVSR